MITNTSVYVVDLNEEKAEDLDLPVGKVEEEDKTPVACFEGVQDFHMHLLQPMNYVTY